MSRYLTYPYPLFYYLCSMRKTTSFTLIGFLLAGLGVLSLILMLFGARFSFLRWLDFWGFGVGFIIKLVMTLLGFVLIFLARVNWGQEIQDLQNEE